VPGSVLAIATSDNAMGGAILTFAFPIILFAVIAVVLYILLFSRPHPRVPAGQVALAGAAAAPDPSAAHASAVAAGMPTASGGGSAESAAEPAGAKRDAAADASTTDGSVSGEAADQGTTEGTEASE
jgi:hypothetical protein